MLVLGLNLFYLFICSNLTIIYLNLPPSIRQEGQFVKKMNFVLKNTQDYRWFSPSRDRGGGPAHMPWGAPVETRGSPHRPARPPLLFKGRVVRTRKRPWHDQQFRLAMVSTGRRVRDPGGCISDTIWFEQVRNTVALAGREEGGKKIPITNIFENILQSKKSTSINK